MIVGTTLFKLDGNPYYSPEVPRGGLAAVFAVDVTHLEGSPTVTFQVEHRNEDEQTFSAAGTNQDVTATQVATWDVTNLKEIVRVKISFAAGDDSTDAAHFLIQAPTWRPYP